jgi:hypothetical protein
VQTILYQQLSRCRYDGVCDKDGCDFGSWRLGDHEYYGPGSEFKIDTTKPFTVVTQFITDDGTANGNLISVGRKYVQDGNVIENSKVCYNYLILIFIQNYYNNSRFLQNIKITSNFYSKNRFIMMESTLKHTMPLLLISVPKLKRCLVIITITMNLEDSKGWEIK